MPRPINADRLYNEILSMNISVGGKQIFHPVVKQRVLDSIEMSDSLDYAPVRHGEWEERTRMLSWCDDDVDVYSVCSACNEENYGETPFCPNCGAKMDAKEDAHG